MRLIKDILNAITKDAYPCFIKLFMPTFYKLSCVGHNIDELCIKDDSSKLIGTNGYSIWITNAFANLEIQCNSIHNIY